MEDILDINADGNMDFDTFPDEDEKGTQLKQTIKEEVRKPVKTGLGDMVSNSKEDSKTICDNNAQYEVIPIINFIRIHQIIGF